MTPHLGYVYCFLSDNVDFFILLRRQLTDAFANSPASRLKHTHTSVASLQNVRKLPMSDKIIFDNEHGAVLSKKEVKNQIIIIVVYAISLSKKPMLILSDLCRDAKYLILLDKCVRKDQIHV